MFQFVRTTLAGAFAPLFSRPADAKQMAAYCHRDSATGPEVLLVTSSHGRWILPKGWPMDGKSGAQTAAQEAWEEAGVKAASVNEAPMGRFTTKKRFKDGSDVDCETHVYAIEVDQCSDAFPEAHKRDRRWVAQEKVADIVDDPALSRFLKAL